MRALQFLAAAALTLLPAACTSPGRPSAGAADPNPFTLDDRGLLLAGHRALTGGRYDAALHFYRSALRRGSLFAGLDVLIATVESRAALGTVAPADTHMIRLIFVDSIVTVHPSTARTTGDRLTEQQREEWRLYFGVLKPVLESFSGGRWTIAVTESRAAATTLPDTPGRRAGPDYLGMDRSFLLSADSVDTYVTISPAHSPSYGLARRYPVVDGVLYGPHRGMAELGAHPSFMTLLHEFFHVVEWTAGIQPAHGFESGVRTRFPGWSGSSELDYYRWHFATTLPPGGWRRLDHTTRWRRSGGAAQLAARDLIAAAYTAIPVWERMAARRLAARADSLARRDTAQARALYEQALAASPYLIEALEPLLARYRRDGRADAAQRLEQRLAEARAATAFDTVVPR